MKKPTFRALALPMMLLACAGVVTAQTTTTPKYNPGVKPAVVRPAKPAVITPAKPAVVKPATPLPPGTILPPPGSIFFTPPTVTPNSPGFVYPATTYPGTVYPGTVYPGTSVVTPVLPSYPSAFIGPTIVRETHGELPPDPDATAKAPMTAIAQAPALRLVAVLGSLKRLDLTTSADVGLAEAPLGVSVAMLVGYAQNKPVRASGDFFGVCWDGPSYFSKMEDTKVGPFLDHPIMTVNELRPGPWELEAGVLERRVDWMRLAVALFEDRSQNPNAKQVNLPRGRRAAMREVLHRVTWTDKGVSLRTAGVNEADALAGHDVTHFGKALATFAEKTMTPVPENERVGIAEWYFPATDLGRVIAACPRFTTETPDGAKLREARAAAGAKTPDWVRTCEIRNEKTRYAAELWFVVVPDAAMNTWMFKR